MQMHFLLQGTEHYHNYTECTMSMTERWKDIFITQASFWMYSRKKQQQKQPQTHKIKHQTRRAGGP